MLKKKKAATVDWNKIPSLDPLRELHQSNPTIFKNRRAKRGSEFMLIEALLRRPETWEAYKKGKQAVTRFWVDHGITLQKPLKATHHDLLTKPVTLPQEVRTQLATFGEVGEDLIIQDLGAMVKLTPDTRVRYNNTVMYGYDGEKECLALLRHPSPRFLCLRLDARYPPETIIRNLRPLLHERHELAKALPPNKLFRFSDRQKKAPFTFPTWLENIRCYDLRVRDNLSFEKIANEVYGGAQFFKHAELAVRRMTKAIAAAEHATAEHNGWPPTSLS